MDEISVLSSDFLQLFKCGSAFFDKIHKNPLTYATNAAKLLFIDRAKGESPQATFDLERRYINMINEVQTSELSTSPAVADNPGTKYPFASVTLSGDQLSAIIAKVGELRGLLPSMPDLTPDERRRMSKLGSKSRGFADLAIETAKTDPGVLPQSVSLNTFVAQDALLRDLSLVQTHVSDVKSKIDDALFQIGNYVFGVSRVVYAVMKTDAAKAKLQEQKTAMKTRFARPKTKSQSVGSETPQADA